MEGVQVTTFYFLMVVIILHYGGSTFNTSSGQNQTLQTLTKYIDIVNIFNKIIITRTIMKYIVIT
jgi:hypothetical protein